VVVVTQGTVEKNPEKIVVPTLEAFKGTDTLVIATTGGSGTVELKKRFPQSNLVIEDFIPFADIMPYADAYITNGGYGGVLLGIGNQLPLIVAGVHEGKNEINARIGFFRLGINLKTEWPKPAQVKKAVEELLSDPSYKENVVKLGKEFDGYNPNELFAYYTNDILQKTRRIFITSNREEEKIY
jgi:UDP:flavonoid glycosyltransferase YjiC (YdhE family)